MTGRPKRTADAGITCYVGICKNNFIHIEQACLRNHGEDVNPMSQQWGICQRRLELLRVTYTCVPEVNASELPADKAEWEGPMGKAFRTPP